jgi:hypothetical protein
LCYNDKGENAEEKKIMKKLLTIGAVTGIALGSSYVGATLAQTKTVETTAPTETDLVVDGVEYTLLDAGTDVFADMIVTTEAGS